MEEEIIKLMLDNWKAVLTTVSTLFVTCISFTWFVAKKWYSRQIEIAKMESSYLEKKLRDKDSHVRGFVELMNQKLSLAEDEPKRLSRELESQRNKYDELAEQNKKLLENIDSNEGGLGLSAYLKDYTTLSIRAHLKMAINKNEEMFPSHRILTPLRKHFHKWDQFTKLEDTNFKELSYFLVIYTTAQTLQSSEIDIKYKKMTADFGNLKGETFQSLSEMLAPFIEKKDTNLGRVINENKKDRQVEYYAALITKKRKEKDDADLDEKE